MNVLFTFDVEIWCNSWRTIVRLIQDAGQEVQLHRHPEWIDEARDALLENVTVNVSTLPPV